MSSIKPAVSEDCNENQLFSESIGGSNLYKKLDNNSKELALNFARYLKYQQCEKDNQHNIK